jgi:hypothetical protein
MKKYVFQLTITEDMVAGDEFWEEFLREDPTGIMPLTEALVQAIEDSNLIVGAHEAKDAVKLLSYSEIEK